MLVFFSMILTYLLLVSFIIYKLENDPLYKIRTWPKNDVVGLLEFCKMKWNNMGWKEHAVERKPDNVWIFHTFDNPNNKKIIEALRNNKWFWFTMWDSSTRGGHHTFKPIY